MVGIAGRLLIVDDERGITKVIESAAVEIGFEVLSIHATDRLEKALQRLKPTTIVLDIAMPGRDGIQLIGGLAADNYHGKIVIISGADRSYFQKISAVAKTRGLMVGGTLQKPFRRQAVVDLLLNLAVATY